MPYSSEDKERIIAQVLDTVASGQSLRASCRSVGVPLATVQDWIDASEERSGQYARAVASLVDVLTGEIEDIADRVEPEAAAVAKARLQIDARKWNLSKIMKNRFGDRVQTELTGKAGGPLRLARELTEAELLAIAAGAGGQPG